MPNEGCYKKGAEAKIYCVKKSTEHLEQGAFKEMEVFKWRKKQHSR